LVSCPYQARSIQREKVYQYDDPTVLDTFPNEYRSVHKRHEVGVVSKCTFCADRIDDGLKKGLRPGVDPEATPMCVVVCPVGARYFGDLDDSESEVSSLIATRRGNQLRPEHGTNPSVFYLPE
jgi:phenylacetyl-CoA:acceptor oxidoreductase subunit 1